MPRGSLGEVSTLVLAQVAATSEIAEGLAKNPLAWGLVLVGAACAYLFKSLMAEQKAHLETVRASAVQQREILTQVVPLASRLTEAVDTLERVTERGA
ncbi:MAG: hypothetical protein AMXMBFR56_72580 [Polyangiaceae bacterium]